MMRTARTCWRLVVLAASSRAAAFNTSGISNGDASDSEGGPALCGNGRVEGTEECDDGNTTNGDGCNSSCKVVCLGSEKKFGVNCYVDSWTFPSDEYRTWDDASASASAEAGTWCPSHPRPRTIFATLM